MAEKIPLLRVLHWLPVIIAIVGVGMSWHYRNLVEADSNLQEFIKLENARNDRFLKDAKLKFDADGDGEYDPQYKHEEVTKWINDNAPTKEFYKRREEFLREHGY